MNQSETAPTECAEERIRNVSLQPKNSSAENLLKKNKHHPRSKNRRVLSWYLVVLLVASFLLTPLSGSEIASAENGLTAGTIARVSNTDGDGVRLRSDASSDANVITTLNETWQVTILGGPFTDKQGNKFYKVEWANRTGYVMTQYLSKSGSGGFGVGSQVRVTGTDGDGVLLRSQPKSSSSAITTLGENWLATVTGGPFSDGSNSYYKLEWAGKTGYASTQYLTYAGKGSGTVSASSNSTSKSGLAVGSQAKVVGTDGDGVRMRQQANSVSPTLNVLGESYLVTVLGGPFNDSDGNSYYRVEWTGYTGYINSKFLTSAGKNAVAGTGGFMRITNTDGDPIRFRTGPSRDSSSNGYVYEGQSLKLLAGPFKDPSGGTWYRLDRNGEVGYVDASFLQRTNSQTSTAPAPAPVTTPKPAAVDKPAQRPIPAPPSSGSTGTRIADYAKQFVGYRYVWGGHSPDAGGFDCSGLVHWVLSQMGYDVGYTVAADLAVGTAVPLDALEPGDILIFVNTYMPGPSHSGIYIGGGRFVHAETESTGVTISGLNESYYASRIYAARRLGV